MIVLRAKEIQHQVTYINLREKPDWFLAISPHGKVPVLRVEDRPLFESNAIAEYLDEVEPPRLHPEDPIKRARNRAWTDFVPDFSKALSAIYYAETEAATAAAVEAAGARVAPVEEALASERGNDGPYFNGERISLVDAAYAPFFQRLALVDARHPTGVFDAFPLVRAWSEALLATDLVRGSVAPSFEAEFVGNLRRRGFWTARLFEEGGSAAAD